VSSYNYTKTADDILRENKLLFDSLESKVLRINLLEKANDELCDQINHYRGYEEALYIIISILKKHEDIALKIDDIANLLNTISSVTINQLVGNSVSDNYEEDIELGKHMVEKIKKAQKSDNLNVLRIDFFDDGIH